MTLVSKRLPVLLAVLIGAAMAFTVWGLMPNAVFADDDEPLELNEINMASDGTLGWGPQYILLDSADDTISWRDGIQITDQEGNQVERYEYDLQLEAVWYSDEERRDHYEDVTNQETIGLMGDEASSGCTEYRLTATPSEESEYVGKASINFYLVDGTSLSYICSEIIFKDPAKVTGWRMRDWFWFWAGDPIVSQVKAECGNADEPLTEGTDYTVTFYERKDGVDIYSPEPEENFLGDKVVDENEQPVAPTNPGDYFAVIEGTDNPYHGGGIFPVSIMGNNQIMFVPENDMDLWSSGKKVYSLQRSGGVVGNTVELKVGFRDGDNWVTEFQKGEAYTYDSQTSTLTLYGDKIVNDENSDSWLCLFAQIGEGDNALTGDEYVQLRLAEYRYDEPGDVELLPGWEERIDSVRGFIRDPNHFDGEDFDQPIKNATIKSQNPADGDVLELWEDHGEWKYRAKHQGSAVIVIEYDDPKGGTANCEFTVTVSDTTYNVDLWSEENVYQGFPGTSIDLRANARKEWVFFEDDDPDNPRYDDTWENFTYKWELSEGDDFATIAPDENEPDRAVLTFKEMPAGWDHIGERVKVKVSVCDTDSDDPTAVRAERENDFWVRDDFYQITPTTVDADLVVGRTITLKPEVRHYQLGKDYTVVDNVDFEVTDYNDEELQVTKTDNGFEIMRIQRWDTNFRVEARWVGDPGESDQWYHLNGKNYRPEFGTGDINVYDDDEDGITLTPEIQDGEDLEDSEYTVRYKVGRCEWNDANEAYDWDYEVDPNSGVYKVSGKSITIYGDKLAQLDRDNLNDLRIIAQLEINDIECESADCWINLRESCVTWGEEHNWIKTVVKNPTLTEVGYEYWICPDFLFLGGCGEQRLVTIPKLIDIADATVDAIPNKTYTGKAQTPALTVKVDGTTLKAGTDYTATYANNTKVGTATATITGKGVYGGTKNATFKIVKAGNPMVVKTKAVTLKVKNVKKKNQTVKQTAAFTVSKNQGKVTYKKKSGDKKITIASDGKITVKKGLKKGKYKFVVNVTAAGDANYNAITKPVTVNITVK